MNTESSAILKPIRERRSTRKFAEKPVEREKILTSIEAARMAPSAENVQPWRFIVLDDPEIISSFAAQVFTGIFSHTRWAAKAPVLIVLAADRDIVAHGIAAKMQKIPYHMIDIGICGEHFILQAQELGLGSCWIGWFNAKKAEKFFKLPPKVKICELIAVGYPQKAFTARKKKLKPAEKMIFFNEWGKGS